MPVAPSVAAPPSNVSSTTKRLYNSRTAGLPRPAPMTSQYGGRVPLPPVSEPVPDFVGVAAYRRLRSRTQVPELDRSDHERESMSPQPQPKPPLSSRGGGGGGPLPSPLTTPIVQSESSSASLSARGQPVPRARRHTPMAAPAGSQHYQVSSPPLLFPFRRHCKTGHLPPRVRQAPIRSHHPHSILEEDEEQEGGGDEDEGGVLPPMEHFGIAATNFGKQQPGGDGGLVDERLRALLMLLNQSGDDGSAVDADHENGIRPKGDTLQYLSQLESVARRLKDQLLMEQPKVSLAQARSVTQVPPSGQLFLKMHLEINSQDSNQITHSEILINCAGWSKSILRPAFPRQVQSRAGSSNSNRNQTLSPSIEAASEEHESNC